MSAPVTGEAREKLRERAAQLYKPAEDSGREPLSIRDIADEFDCSYGLVWNLLAEAGVTRRPANGGTARLTHRNP